jgi:hypothetical protein
MSIRQLVKQASAVPSKLPWLARETTEHIGDVAGYGLMTAGVLDAIRQRHLQSKAVAPPASPSEGSVLGGERGQLGTDIGGLGMMAVPTIAALRHGSPKGSAGGGSKTTNLINLASLAALAAPAADSLQARLRSQPGEDPEHKHLMSHGVHNALELGGLAGFGVSALRGHEAGHGLGTASTLAGLGTLAAPYIDDVQAHARTAHGEDPQAKRLFTPQARSMSELAGLGLLAAPAVSHLIPTSKHAESTEKVAMSHARDALSHVLDPDLEKVAASLAGWSIPQTRSGRRSMSVMTMLKKDAEGTLRKTANWLGTPQSNTGIGTPETGAEARSKRYPWEAPSREDGYSDKAKVMDRRSESAVVPPHGVTLTDVKLD